MKSGLRGGKPRDMATMSHGGKTSRGAGAAQRGFEYNVYKKGGKVKKYEDGGAIRDPETGDYKRDPATGTRQYASFSDWMGDLFGKGKKTEAKVDTSKPRDIRPPTKYEDSAEAARREGSSGGPAGPGARVERAPRPSEHYDRTVSGPLPPPPAPELTAAQRAAMLRRRRDAAQRLARRQASRAGIGGSGVDPSRYTSPEGEMQSMYPPRPLDLTRPEYRPESAYEPYRKGGTVKKAGGGSCRGMGAAQRGGKYSVR